jgi:iron complex transport system ATP-binding protein
VTSDSVLRLQGVVVRRGSSVLVGPLDWAVGAGERWVVVGPNGSGKTTLVQLASVGLLPSSGSVEILGRRVGRTDARALRRRIGIASAALAAAIPDRLVPLDVVVSAADGSLVPWWSRPSDADRARAGALLRELGVAHVDRPLATLSTGERQRVAIARALMPDPDLLLLDEPAAGLDLGAREDLVERLATIAASPRPAAVLLVTHHVEEIPPGFDHALVLGPGRAVAAGPMRDALSSASLSAAFGQPLLVDRRDGRFAARRDVRAPAGSSDAARSAG